MVYKLYSIFANTRKEGTMDLSPFQVPFERKMSLRDYDPEYTGKYENKEGAEKKLKKYIKRLKVLQNVFYAEGDYAILALEQGMDSSGKDSLIKYVMSGINPMGCQVFSFKTPSKEELKHGFLWRCMKAEPERGRIGIFNRSYYEETAVVRVHPELLAAQKIPKAVMPADVWKARYEYIRNYEKYLVENGTVVLKVFLNIPKEEQRSRFFERLEKPEKNWKFSANDIKERVHWNEYMSVYEDAISETNTPHAPWHIIPGDHKWFSHLVGAEILVRTLEYLNLRYPTMSPEEHEKNLTMLKEELKNEKT